MTSRKNKLSDGDMQKLVRVNKAVSVTALSSRCIGIALRALSCFETLKRKLKHIPSLWKLERQYQRDWEKIFEHSPLKTGNSDSPAENSCEIWTNPSIGDLCVVTEVVHYKYANKVTTRVRDELQMYVLIKEKNNLHHSLKSKVNSCMMKIYWHHF